MSDQGEQGEQGERGPTGDHGQRGDTGPRGRDVQPPLTRVQTIALFVFVLACFAFLWFRVEDLRADVHQQCKEFNAHTSSETIDCP